MLRSVSQDEKHTGTGVAAYVQRCVDVGGYSADVAGFNQIEPGPDGRYWPNLVTKRRPNSLASLLRIARM